MVQVNNETIILIICMILGIIIIKFLGRSLFRVIGVIVLIVIVLIYTYFYTNFFVEHKENKVVHLVENKMQFTSIFQFQKKHCQGVMRTRKDSITCECIVTPLINDMTERLSEEEIKTLESNKQLYLKELMTSLKKTQKEIQFNLKERNAIYLWNKMVLNLREGKGVGEE